MKWRNWSEWKEGAAVQIKQAGFLTKLVVLILLIAASVTLLRMRGQIQEIQARRDDLRAQVAGQLQTNEDLRDAIDHSGDPDRQADLARTELGLTSPGEKVIIFTD